MSANEDISVHVLKDTFVEMIWDEDAEEWQVFLNGPTADCGLEYIDSFEDKHEAADCLCAEIRKIIVGED